MVWKGFPCAKKLWNLLFPRIYLKKKKKSTGSIHSQSSPRPLRGRRCFPSLDLATKGRKWKRNVSGSFSGIYQKLKALFPLFLLPTIPQDSFLYIASRTRTKSGSELSCIFPNFIYYIRSDQISCSVVSDSLQPHESQHTRPPCPSPTPGVHSDSRPSSQ